MTFKQYLESLCACEDAIEWAGDKTIEQVVADCHRGDWLLWLAKKCGVELQPFTLAKGHCANTVRHLMTDERSMNAVNVAIAFGEGRATRDELDAAYAAACAASAAVYSADAAAAAARAAYYAAADAAYAAAAAAASAAAYAARAAYYASACAASAARAAYYASDAADAAYAAAYSAAAAANQKQTADICRKYIGDLIIEKVNQQLNQTNQ